MAKTVPVREIFLTVGAVYDTCPDFIDGSGVSKSLFIMFTLKACPPRVDIFLREFDDLLGKLKDCIRLG